MRRLMIPIIALSIAIVPASLEAQQAQRAQPGRVELNPADLVWQRRAELQLNAAQMVQVQRLQKELEQQNAPLIAQLPQVGPGAGRSALAGGRAGAGAGGRVGALRDSVRNMDPEQRAQARARLEARRDSAGADARRDPTRTRADSMSADDRGKGRAAAGQRKPGTRPGQAAGQGRQGAAGQGREGAAEMRPVLEQIRENNARAMQQIESILTEEQRAKLRAQRPAGGPGGGGAR